MRVVAGEARGRPLVAPQGSTTRPTSDRVRESVFNVLYSLGDVVAGARVLDVFAGSGALGIEAVSRGAASATFVDRDRAAIVAIEQNVGHTGMADRAEIVRADVLDWLDRVTGRYDVVLCDPPYDFDRWPELLTALARVTSVGTGSAEAQDAGVAVLESDREIDAGEGWQVVRTRRYGGTVVSIVRRRSA
jgi:16S rRNA (guanine966-N2)-methyltransferase